MELREASQYLSNLTNKIVSEYRRESRLSPEDISVPTIIQAIEVLKKDSLLLTPDSENINSCMNIAFIIARCGVDIYLQESFYLKGIAEIKQIPEAKRLLKVLEIAAVKREKLVVSSVARNGIQSSELAIAIDNSYGQYLRKNRATISDKPRSSAPWEELFMDVISGYRKANLSECYEKPSMCPFMSNNLAHSLEGKRMYFPKIKWVQFTELAGLKKSGMKPASFPKQVDAVMYHEMLKTRNLSPQIQALVEQYGVVKFPMITPKISLMKGVTFVEDTEVDNELAALEQILQYFCTKTGHEDSYRFYQSVSHLLFYPFRTPWPVCIDPYVSLALGVPYLPFACETTELAEWSKTDDRLPKYLDFFASKIAQSRFIAIREDSSSILMEKLRHELT